VLTDLTGLEGLNYIGGIMSVSGNVAMVSFAGLENLDSIGGSLWIGKNIQLENLSALSNLKSIGGGISIDSNLLLTSLSGLANIASSSINYLSIYYNPLLLECEVQSICDYLAGTPEYVYIINNAIGCNNQEEVEEACESAGTPDLSIAGSISIFPNPAQSIITISIPPGTEIDEIVIYNRLGQKVMYQDKAGNTVDVASLLPGMYVVEMIVNGIVVREKLVKL
ncbi:MAG: T9SS type A sorting domain-containing protein, partial [Bacteroidales bacterium]|nr:T9SS type A sorting domain-containing protein [Bacteroidales bacterium]